VPRPAGLTCSITGPYDPLMDRPYIEWVRIENYRCIRSVDLHLTPLHALIGPNDSGKSSLLRGVSGVSRTAVWTSNDLVLSQAHLGLMCAAYPAMSGALANDALRTTFSIVTPSAMLRLDPDDLRAADSLILTGQPLWFRNERGLGLPALFDALLSRNIPAFLTIAKRFTELFPTVQALRMINPDYGKKTLGLTLTNGTEVGTEAMSEGMLYWLAFAVLEYLNPFGMFLIEEPENGLHPSRIAEVMRILREVSKRTQVVMATHSPLIINELRPEEVTIVTRTPEAGTICTPMTATKNFAERSKIYALGELWLSYADGDLERELVTTDASVPKAG
jgi:energy-coupling factor transporter ATP-binding protein EcfA2